MTELLPVRRGRMAGTGDWQSQYRALSMSAEEAAALVRDGDVVSMTSSASLPVAMDRALAEHLRRINGHIELNTLDSPRSMALLQPDCIPHVAYHANFFFDERYLQDQGNIHFVPTNLSKTGDWMCARHPRVAILTCSPPNEEGWMSRSVWGAMQSREMLEQCETVIVEVNARLPFCCSDGEAHMLFHVSEADAIVEADSAILESPSPEADETDRIIAGYIAEMVQDGSCVQFGLGGLANAVGQCLAYAGKKDLGVQSEVLSSCLIELIEKGVVNNSRKQTCRGRTAGTYFVGDRKLYDFVRENPLFCQKEIAWTNDPRNIARNDRVVSINNAMEIDLTGQVNAETIGARQYSGTGGQLEWVLGSQWSKDGKSIIAIRSCYRDRNGELHSKIRPLLTPGSIVTTPRTCVQYVVTEYGVADLRYQSLSERARALTAIAHPDFRGELARAARL
jgi:4-hydroxybutyrate CoA-transferase